MAKKKVSKFIYWTPRILSIAFLLFLAIFSLDVFGNGYTFWETVVGLLMHNIPVFILLILLIIAWKHELVGAVAFTSAGLLYILLIMLSKPWDIIIYGSIMISGPAFLIGILFWKNWVQKKRKR